MEKFLKKNYKIIVGAILFFMFVVSTLNAKNDSATFDEVAHIPASYSYVTKHDTRLNPEHPPLIKDLAGIPLLFLNLNFDTNKAFWTGDLPNMWDQGQWEAGRHLLYEASNDADEIIFWARMPIVILSLILGLFLFKWGKEIGGITAGLFVLILYAFDPNILGHNHYVTTDLGIAAFLTFSFYYFLKFIKNPSKKNIIFAGIFLGLLLVTKFSSIVAMPVYVLIIFVYAFFKNNRDNTNNWKFRIKNIFYYFTRSAAVFIIATAVIWTIYELNIYKMPKETFAKTINFFFLENDSNKKTVITNKTLNFLNENNLTRPLGAYLFGPAWMFKRVSGGNGAYFMQKVGNGFIEYFPVVFLIKETIPFLLLILISLLFTLKQSILGFAKTNFSFSKIQKLFKSFLILSVSYWSMLLFIIIYAFLSITGGLNIGFRHLFPILPFAYILITKKIFDLTRNKHIATKRTIWIPSLAIIFWIILIPIFNYPSYTSYFNESIGGSKNGYKYVTDSNTDWGQDLKRLSLWIEKYNSCGNERSPRQCTLSKLGADYTGPIEKINTDYFGGGNPKIILGEKYSQWWDSMRPVKKGWYAISTNYLQGSIYDKEKKNQTNNYLWTKEFTPVAKIGNSILIFNITVSPINQ